MDLEAVRRIVEEEVVRALAAKGASSSGRRRRPLLLERDVEEARRRGLSTVRIEKHGIVTPAAADRAKDLGVAIERVEAAPPASEVAPLVDEVLRRLLDALAGTACPRPVS